MVQRKNQATRTKRLSAEDNSSDHSLVEHLTELRSRLLRIAVATGVIFLCLFPFANELYQYLSVPLLRYLPEGVSMIAIEVAAPFLVPFKLVLLLSLLAAMPYLLYQIWAFVAPGLYRTEQRIVLPLVVSSTLLFYLGVVFAYFVVFPLMFAFFTAVAPAGVTVMTDIAHYLSFVFKIFLAFGIAFEVPVATVLLVRIGAVTPEKLAARRPYLIVGAFVVGMALTPPDVLSQVLLAIPVWLLFELGLLLARWLPAAQDATAHTTA